MRWLIGEFGLQRARNARVILPTPEFFPEPYDGSAKAGRMLFKRVCRYMDVDPRPIKLVFPEERRPMGMGWEHHDGAAGLYEGSDWSTRIRIEASALHDPLSLIATAAHELGHVLLLGQGRLTGDEPDHEEITDLVTIYFGLGVFTANSRVRDRSQRDGTMESWSIRKLGYLDQPTTGYALGLFARLREEDSPAWASHLCADVRAAFKQTVRWLSEYGDRVLDSTTRNPTSLSDDELPPGFDSGR